MELTIIFVMYMILNIWYFAWYNFRCCYIENELRTVPIGDEEFYNFKWPSENLLKFFVFAYAATRIISYLVNEVF